MHNHIGSHKHIITQLPIYNIQWLCNQVFLLLFKLDSHLSAPGEVPSHDCLKTPAVGGTIVSTKKNFFGDSTWVTLGGGCLFLNQWPKQNEMYNLCNEKMNWEKWNVDKNFADDGGTVYPNKSLL